MEEDWSYPEMVVMACQVLVNRVLARKCLQKLLPEQDILCTELCNVTVCHCHKLFFNFHQLPKETTITVNNYSHSSCLHRASMIIKYFIIQLMYNI